MDALTTQYPAALRATLFAATSLVLAACGGDGGSGPLTPPPPPPPVTVTVDPTAVTLAPGETQTITATVSGGSGTVSFASSNSGVATVASNGLVTAAAPGTATVTASVSGATATATTLVTVTELPTELSLSIVSITQDGQPIDPNEVSGVIDVLVNYDVPAGFEGRIDVLLDDAVVGSLDLPSGAAAVNGARSGCAGCPILEEFIQTATNQLRPGGDGTVVPSTQNGDRKLTVQIFQVDEVQALREVDWEQPLTLNNRSAFALTKFEGERQATGEEGFRWNAGSVEIETGHVEFDPQAQAADNWRLGGPIEKDKVILFDVEKQEEFVAEVSATEFGVAGFVPFDRFAFIEGQVRVLQQRFQDGQGEERAVPFSDFWIQGEDGVPVLGPSMVQVDQVGPTSPFQFSSGTNSEFWIDDAWTSDRLVVNVGHRFAETVTDGGSGLAGCELLAGLPGEEKVPLFVPGWAETIEPRLGFAYDCKDLTNTHTIFGFFNTEGAEQKVGVDRTPANLSTLFTPQYLQWQQINGPPLLGREMSDALSGVATLQISIVHAELVEGLEQLVRTCIFGLPLPNGGCEPVDVEEFAGNPVEVDLSWYGLQGHSFLRERSKDNAGNLGPTLGSQFGLDFDSPTFTTAFATDGSFTPNGSETITFGGADNVNIQTARFELRYGDPVSLVLGYGGTEPRGDFYSFNSADVVRSLDVEITVDRVFQSIQVADEDEWQVGSYFNAGPFGGGIIFRDFGGNEARQDVGLPQMNTTDHDYADEVVKWHSMEEVHEKICNPGFEGACPGVETQQRIVVRSDTEGAGSETFFHGSDLEAYFLKEGGFFAPSQSGQPDHVPVWQPLSEFVTGVTVTSTTVGDRTQHMYEIVLDATLGMEPGTYEVAVFGIDDEGHALMSNSKTFEVIRF